MRIVDLNNTDWSFQPFRGHSDLNHVCYGTASSIEVSSKLQFKAERYLCGGGSCLVKFEYLHSWNASYIAAAACDLYALNMTTREPDQLIDRVSIIPNKCGHENKDTVTGTVMCPHVLKLGHSVTDKEVFYSLQCRSLELGKLACIGSVELFIEDSYT